MVTLGLSLACSGSRADADTRRAPPVAPAAPAAPAPIALPPGKVTPTTALFVATSQPPARDLAAPWSLTASDGSGLVMTRVDARAVVEGPLAFTELHLYFSNPEPRVREGTFSITLPAGAAVSRFAMENNGQFMEAEVVEKQLARRAYEDFLHRKQDPALLEKAEGNQFSARVFPIPPSSDKHLVISFSQEVTPGRYTLPLRGLARTERLDVRVQVRGASGGIAEQTFSERNWTPDRDIVVDGTRIGAPAAIAAGDLVAARVPIELPSAAEPPAGVTLLVDTSASRALGFAAQARAVRELVEALGKAHGGALPVQVVAFDQVTAPIYDGRADAAYGPGGLEAQLVQRGALGASDLGQALSWLASHAPRPRVVVISDGVFTAGARPDALPQLAKQLGARGVTRIDVALIGGIRDGEAAAAITRAGLARTGAVLDLERGAAEVARRIGLAVRTELPITVDGARWVFPAMVAAAQAGDEVTVFARRDPQAGALASAVVTVAGRRLALSPVAVTPALLDRAVAGAEIAELDARLATLDGAAAHKLRAEIVRRSVAARVISSQTSLLVLESDADYRRYGIARTALADILTIGPSGVELTHRVAPPLQIADPPRSATKPATKTTTNKPEVKAKIARGVDVDDEDRGGADDARLNWPADKADRADGPGGGEEAEKASEPPRAALGRRAAAESPADSAAGNAPSQGSAAAAPAPSGNPGSADYARIRQPVSAQQNPLADAAPPPAPPPPPPPQAARPRRAAPAAEIAVERRPQGSAVDDDGLGANRRKPALHGPLAEITRAVAGGRSDAALAQARAWHARAPGDVLALIGLGEALEARRDLETAARAYGSIIDLYPARADFRRFAGERLERLARPGTGQRALIIDTYKRAVEQRPDHLTGHRLLAYALVRDGQHAAAFAAILAAIDRRYPANRFAGAERILAEDAGMLAAAYIAQVPGKRGEVMAELERRRVPLATQPSTRFIMYWETDANDVDFHIRDARGGHAWYSRRQLPSGGELYADITTGYGPECFAIQGTPKAGPYQLSINYYSQGPMGYGMGLLQIQKFDGKGNLSFEDRPYVIMTNQAFVSLGTHR